MAFSRKNKQMNQTSIKAGRIQFHPNSKINYTGQQLALKNRQRLFLGLLFFLVPLICLLGTLVMHLL